MLAQRPNNHDGKIVVFGSQGSPAMSAEAIMASNGPDLPVDGLLGRLIYLDSDVTGCSGAMSTLNTAMQAIVMVTTLFPVSTQDLSTISASPL